MSFRNVARYQLHHPFTTLAQENGMDVKNLSATIGHVSAATTLDIYSHMTDTMQMQAAVNVNRKIGGTDAQKDNSHRKYKHARKQSVRLIITEFFDNEKKWRSYTSGVRNTKQKNV